MQDSKTGAVSCTKSRPRLGATPIVDILVVPIREFSPMIPAARRMPVRIFSNEGGPVFSEIDCKEKCVRKPLVCLSSCSQFSVAVCLCLPSKRSLVPSSESTSAIPPYIREKKAILYNSHMGNSETLPATLHRVPARFRARSQSRLRTSRGLRRMRGSRPALRRESSACRQCG